jgi:hypothetical protein
MPQPATKTPTSTAYTPSLKRSGEINSRPIAEIIGRNGRAKFAGMHLVTNDADGGASTNLLSQDKSHEAAAQ